MVDEQMRGWIEHVLTHAILEAIPLMNYFGWHSVIASLAEHRPSGEAFILLSQPDGPFLAISPFGDAGEKVLRAAVPDARPWEPSGAVQWANSQRWEILASKRAERAEAPNDVEPK